MSWNDIGTEFAEHDHKEELKRRNIRNTSKEKELKIIDDELAERDYDLRDYR